ncbi:hypothetical protein CFC21_016420 [Triticum aestivum]|uniref:Uncharacterized protein n=3 Tax=Triticum TaxID=4564 RepID=A0A3B6AV75_WHEAT|nr:hypothetical protein CFC21_016420 [Triticum aestivum]
MAGAFELYWQSAIGRAVMETLDEMVLSPDHAISVQVQFDEFMSTGQPAQEQGLLQWKMQMTCVLDYGWLVCLIMKLITRPPQGIILLGSYLFSAKSNLNLLKGHIWQLLKPSGQDTQTYNYVTT